MAYNISIGCYVPPGTHKTIYKYSWQMTELVLDEVSISKNKFTENKEYKGLNLTHH